jgi:hypothetical protein
MQTEIGLMLWHLVLVFIVGAGVGGFIGANMARAKTAVELMETYRHLLDYGRTTPPRAAVRSPEPTAEERVLAEIHATSRANLAEYISKEAGISQERANEHAEELLANFETTGTLPT